MVCKSKPEKEVNYVEENSSDDDFYVGCVETVNVVDASEWYEEMTVYQKLVRFQLDPGSKCNDMPLSIFNQLKVSRNP